MKDLVLDRLEAAHERLGTAGFALAVIALVVALAGSAYAATGALTRKQKKEVTKIAKKYAGKPGSQGPTGPAGANGANGKDGANGAAGPVGPTGATGAAGAKGPTGPAGVAGELWTAGGTLPENATETGVWTLGFITAGAKPEGFAYIRAPISFTIPLAAELPAANVHYLNAARKEVNASFEEVTSTACLGSAAAPTATAGHLCIYTGALKNALSSDSAIYKPGSEFLESSGASTTGAVLGMVVTAEKAEGAGTWAVTAP